MTRTRPGRPEIKRKEAKNMKEAKKTTQVTDQICKQVHLMRKGGANQTEIAKLLGISAPTISRIEKAGYDVNVYLENKRIAREKEKATKQAEEEAPAEESEETEQVPGQIAMELPQKEPEEPDRIVKLMRFQAHEVDLIVKRISECFDLLILKTDKLNDTLSMILRAIRRE